MQRLTSQQYRNTVSDLLGPWATFPIALPADEVAAGFESNVTVPVTRLHVESYASMAESLAAQAREHLAELLPCDPDAEGADECARTFIEAFGRRAYRGPLDDNERELLWQLYLAGSTGATFADGIQLVVEGILQAPQFLYRTDFAPGGGSTPLSNYELATRLSYFLWQTAPDQALMEAADTGELSDPQVLRRHAQRMLQDPRAARMVSSFYQQWLELDQQVSKDPELFPEYSASTRDDMLAETRALSQFVILHGDGRLDTLMTTNLTWVSDSLATLYGAAQDTEVEVPAQLKQQLPTGFFPARLDASQRAGLLTQASLLSTLGKRNQTAPIHRGAFVLERLLCRGLPDPPPSVDAAPPEPDPNLTAREQYQQHSVDPACFACHEQIDPVGFGFEGYDSLGRFRTHDRGGNPIDASGSVVLDGQKFSFDGAVELAHALSTSREHAACTTRQWLRFALGRREAEGEECIAQDLSRQLAASEGNLRDLVLSIVDNPRFRLHTEGGN